MRIDTARKLDERREVVADLLQFIRDFNRLDTTMLIERVMQDQTFLEAAEAVLLTAVGPWKSIDALRDFCVLNLKGEAPPNAFAEHARSTRVSPFSVPYTLLKTLAPNPGRFNPRNLQTLSLAEALEYQGLAGEVTRWETKPHGGENWLITTAWVRTVPAMPRETQIRFQNVGADQILHEGALWALAAEPMPCFWWLPSYTPLEVLLTRQREAAPATALLVIEGWRYVKV